MKDEDEASGSPAPAGGGAAPDVTAETKQPEHPAAPPPPDDPPPSDDPGAAGEKPKKPRKRRGSFWRELPVLVVIALVLALVIKTWLIQAFFIPSGSMENTLKINDRVLVNKFVYHTRDIQRGDIVVFNGLDSWDPEGEFAQPTNPVSKALHAVGAVFGVSADEKDYIKRVIGTPGDHVRCCDAQGRITVNGHPLNEKSYLYPGNAPSDSLFDVTVPAGNLWVMGDHRQVSSDSRAHLGDPGGGAIPENKVVGRAFVRVWPPSRIGDLPIPATFGTVGATAAGYAAPAAPLVLGVVGAVPLTWLQRRARPRLRRRG
jgi:signal peptidase I